MEYVYIATSKSFPGMVKIGRTSRKVSHRMHELSDSDYGPSSFSGESEWEAVKVIEVENSAEAEAILHEHFAHLRVEDSRELFYVEDYNEISAIATDLVDGKDGLDTFDTLDSLTAGLSILSGVTGVNELILNYKPNNKTNIKAADYLKKWDKNLENKSKNSKNIIGKAFYKTLNISHKTSRFIGKKGAKLVSEVTKNTNLDYWAIDRENIPSWNYTEIYREFLNTQKSEMEATKGDYEKVMSLAKHEVELQKFKPINFKEITETINRIERNKYKYPNYTNPYAHNEISIAYLNDAKLKTDKVGMYWQEIIEGINDETGKINDKLHNQSLLNYELACNEWSNKFNKDFLKSQQQALISYNFALLEPIKRLAISYYYGRGIDQNYQLSLVCIYLYSSFSWSMFFDQKPKKLEESSLYTYRKLIINNISTDEFKLIDTNAAKEARKTLYHWQDHNMINLYLPSGDSYREAGIV